jgi:hypothetical protein
VAVGVGVGFGVELGVGVGVIVGFGFPGCLRDGLQSRGFDLAATSASDSALGAGAGR